MRKQTRVLRVRTSGFEPVAEVGTRGALPMPSIGSNMNVINISAKKLELDLGR